MLWLGLVLALVAGDANRAILNFGAVPQLAPIDESTNPRTPDPSPVSGTRYPLPGLRSRLLLQGSPLTWE